jgi:hypothetical protein
VDACQQMTKRKESGRHDLMEEIDLGAKKS